MGFILASLLIPLFVLIAIVWGDSGWHLYSSEDRKKCFLFLLLNIVVAILINTGLYYGATSKTRFNEILNYQVLSVRHLERWTTEESRTETYSCGTDSDGNTKYCTRTVYYTKTHGPYWYAFDNLGNRRRIDQNQYTKWRRIWDNEDKIGENRGTSAFGDRSITGGIYSSNWNHEFNTIFPYQSIGRYVNKIRASDSVLSRSTSDQELIEKFPRPADSSDYHNSIRNYSEVSVSQEDQMIFSRLNAKLGVSYQVHNIIMLFDANEYTQYVVQDVLNAWDGPNKNELVVFIGVRDNSIVWSESHSWSDHKIIHAMVARNTRDLGELDFEKIKDILHKNIVEHWRRKSFQDFDYISVRIHWGWIMAAYLVTIIVSFKAYYWVNWYEKNSCSSRCLGHLRNFRGSQRKKYSRNVRRF